MKFIEIKLIKYFDVDHVQKLQLNGTGYVKDDLIIHKNGVNPYIAAVSTNNGIKGYSNYATNNKGDCITLSTTADSSNTIFYQAGDFIGRQQIAGIRRKDGKYMGPHIALYIITLLKKHLVIFNYGTKLNIDYLRNIKLSLPTSDGENPDWDYMEKYIKNIQATFIKKTKEENDKWIKDACKIVGVDSEEILNPKPRIDGVL